MADKNSNSLDIAVVGISCVFPGSSDKEEFFEHLCHGVNATKFLSDEELLKRGIKKEDFEDSNYVRAVCELDGIDQFDASFFGFAPKEAICMDPQQRIFLECCYEAFEDAGYVRNEHDLVGVFAGCSMNTYVSEVLATDKSIMDSLNEQQIMIGNDKDFLPTLVSYKLNLKGPSVSINTACSTSLVAIHYAKTSLLLGECDVAVAGGVSVVPNHNKGYRYVKDSFQSPDGLCHAFDEEAKGTVWGEGCGVVILKRLKDAQKNNDNILAVIKGSAVNNDGADKVGYTAPSVGGQAEVVSEALAVADVSADQVMYVEAHGTGTQLGDVIEIEALSSAFREDTDRCGYCRIGSVKPNIGHLGSAAGVAGFIKAVMSINKRMIPPSINFRTANRKINFERTPFQVNHQLYKCKQDETFIFGVSSMGIGGTNCHIILGPPPEKQIEKAETEKKENDKLFLFSAKTEYSLKQIMDKYADYFKKHPDLRAEDVAYTLQCGREFYPVRKAFYCKTIEEAADLIEKNDGSRIFDKNTRQDVIDGMLLKWLRGDSIDWSSVYKEEQVVKQALPTYPFEKKRFWVNQNRQEQKEEDYYNKQQNQHDWFYGTVWKQTVPCTRNRKPEKQTYWVFNDKLGYGTQFDKKLREQGQQVIMIEKGTAFQQSGNDTFIINPFNPEDLKKLTDIQTENGKLPDKIIYCWGLMAAPDTWADEELLLTQKDGVFGLVKLIKCIGERKTDCPIGLYVITSHIFTVIGNETLNVPASTMIGMCSVIQQEYETIDCSLIDIDLEETGRIRDGAIHIMLNEIQMEVTEPICAFRNHKRYIKCFDVVKNEEEIFLKDQLKEDKCYLVFNCFDGVGLQIVTHIAKHTKSKVLLLGEGGFPAQGIWDKMLEEVTPDEELRNKIKAAKELEHAGAVYVSSMDQLRTNANWLSETEQKYGEIDGIIYAGEVGILSRGQIAEFDEEVWGSLLLSMYSDIRLVDRTFSHKKLSFKIMINGLVSILGGLGAGGVSALLNFIKSYCIKQNQISDGCWSVQCWDGSQAGWENIKSYLSPQMYEVIEKIALTNEEVWESFDHSFHFVGMDEIAISATELNTRYNRWGKANMSKKNSGLQKHIRMESLSVPYQQPNTDMEKKLVEIVSDLLGIEGIGIDDDFFELGGHSLLGVQMLGKLNVIYHVDLDLPVIYQCPTIKKIAQYIGTLTNN